MRLSRHLLWALLVAIGLTILAPVLASLYPLQLPDAQTMFAIGLLIVVHVVLALGCAIPLERGLSRGWMRSGIIASVMSLLAWSLAILLRAKLPYLAGQRAAVWPTAWACLMMVVGLLLMPRSHGTLGRLLRAFAIVLCSLLGLAYCASVTFHPGYGSASWTPVQWEPIEQYENVTGRINLALVFLAAGAVTLTFLSLLATRDANSTSSVDKALPLSFDCPRCGHAQTGRTGGYRCESCGLSITVRIS